MPKSILFLDDQPTEWIYYHEMLAEELKADVLVARTEKEGLDLLRKRAAEGRPVDGLVLDIGFPSRPLSEILLEGVDAVRAAPADSLFKGARLYAKLRDEFPRLAILILSVRSKQEVEQRHGDIVFECQFLRKGQDHPLAIYKAIKDLIT